MRVAILCVLLSIIAAAYAAELIQGENPIQDKYIIVLNEAATPILRTAFLKSVKAEIVRDKMDTTSEVTGVFTIGKLVGYFATLSPHMVKFHLQHPLVRYVEQDRVVSINDAAAAAADVITQSDSTWGLARISRQAATGAFNYYYDDAAGEGVEVWIIDTGVYPENTDFGGRASNVFNAITGEPDTDLNGHGTHCAGTAAGTKYGVAKKATIYGVKVLGQSGSGTLTGVIQGVEYTTNNHGKRSVANMSLGSAKSTTVNLAVQESIATGIAYAVAAGNENTDACSRSPASVPTAVTVGAITSTNARSSFSNYGTCVDVFAPGSSVLSDWIGSPNATNTISGTSMASPHVCGILAQQWSVNPSLNGTSLVAQVLSQATANQVTTPGTGSPNLIAFSSY